MGKRVYPDNIFWVCFCCGGLPIIASIKGALNIVPITLIHLVSMTLISIILLPHDIVLTYYTLCKT
jgi:hypothetical protein